MLNLKIRCANVPLLSGVAKQNHNIDEKWLWGIHTLDDSLFLSESVIAIGWKEIDGAWYYFDTTGVLQTGWTKINGAWYYFRSSRYYS